MPKLKGLLDSANAKLAGLLGDFPQGFNAGAVAGFPGWAGDMAYLADTARLALTGADSQAAPEDYVGTTDYIAKQAGFPVPQTLSGQLGAAVGGLMSPGPGDLAKFAPVLSAIPFWHGSPHKYDAVDLSKIGTGEGAQAYGHGYYGADSKATAKQYAEALQTYKTTINGVPLTPDMPEFAPAMSIAAQGYDRALKNAEDALNSGFVDPVAGAAEVERIKALKGAKIEQVGEQNLYRGEYRWPDPAKEAATPLTGEDLLDWDRPLSEQSDAVKNAVTPERLGLSVKKVGDWFGYVNEQGRLVGYAAKDPESLRNEWMRGRGDHIYQTFVSAYGNDAAASKALAEAGIPGIRYLDQMSRGAGEGTRNYVMFDDKGIKLLERNGEPLKAADIKFDDSKTWYHTTTEDFDEFDPSKGSKTAAFGPGIYVSEDVNDSARWAKSKEGARTIAVQLAPEHILRGPLSEQQAKKLSEYLGREVKAGDPIPYLSLERRGGTVSEGAKAAGFGGVEHYGSGAGANAKNIVITDPSKVRIIDDGRKSAKAAEDFAARRAGKAKPYREAINGM